MIPVIDVFAGPGGLGEGFAAFKNGSRNPFGLCLSIEKDEFAHQTLLLRTFYRQFDRDSVPDGYYSVLRGEISCEELFSRHPNEAALCKDHAWQAELGLTPWADVTTRISKALSKRKEWVLIGGPPCQAYSLVGRARRNGIRDYDPENDNRTTLYREYLKIIAYHWPAVFVMENVPGLLSHLQREERIFDRMLDDLRDPAATVFRSKAKTISRRHGYKMVSLVPRQGDLFSSSEPDDYVVRSEEFGIPQKRHRVILLGIRDDLMKPETKLVPAEKRIPAAHVLNPLPRLRSGLSKEYDSAERWRYRIQQALTSKWLPSLRSDSGNGIYKQLVKNLESISLPRHDRGERFIEYDAAPDYQPDWFTDKRLGGVCNHETRGHIADDLHRYIFVSSFAEVYKRSPKLGDFPKGLLPDHKNVNGNLEDVPFSDRFRVQLRDQPATTVTSHVAKDGHYYIHPDPRQCRSLTVRESARLQTFPDSYLFRGPRTEQYTQVGNAVPPLLARQIAHVVYRLFKDCGLE